jgi:hypothetical protein
MTGNPLSGHTKGNMTLTTHTSLATPTAEDGLFDGEHIISPTLTNLYEGVHGNGILLEEDTASGDSDRNNPLNLAGNVNGKASSNHYEVVVRGGYAVIDGVAYEFGGGTTVDVDIQNASNYKSVSGTVSALTSGQEALVVIYVSSVNDTTNANKRIYWEMGTPVSSGYPLAPHSFLNAPTQKGASQNVKQSVVLAVLRCVYESGSGDLNLKVTEINDKRVFIKPTPIYFTPVTTGAVGATTAVDSHTDLDNLHGGGEEAGALANSRMGAMWQSYDSEGNQVMFYSGKDSGGNRFTRRIFNSVLSSTSTSITVTSADENVLMLTPSGTCTVTPSGTFPDGHVITIKNLHASNTVNFNSLGAFGQTVKQYVYDKTNSSWNSIEVIGTATGTVTSIATTAPITGGTITTTGTIGISAATTSAAGSMSSADKTKLDAIPTTRAHMFAKITTPGAALVSTVPAVIQHSTTEYDEGGDFLASDYAFVAPRDGYYLVSVGFYLNLTPTWSFSMVYKSTDGGVTYPSSGIVIREVSGSGQKNQLTTVVKLDANDRLRHYANASFSSGTYQVQSANTALTYFRVSELI